MSSAQNALFKFNFEAEQPMKETTESDHTILTISSGKS